MQRRTTLHLGISAGFALLAGCTNSGSSSSLSTDGDDDMPIEVEADALLLTSAAASDTLGGTWNASEPFEPSPITRGTDAVRGYVAFSEGDSGPDGWITTSVWTFDAVEAAREAFDSHGYQTGYGFEDREIAIESIAGTVNKNEGAVLFRDANVMGAISRTDPQHSGDSLVEATLELGVSMHTAWRSE